MPNFRYKARDRFGEAVLGVMEGASGEAIRTRLGELGLIPIQVADEKESGPIQIGTFFKRFERVKPQDMVLFCRQLATMIHAGIPLAASLLTLSEQTGSKKLSRTLKEVVQRIERGASFSEALTFFPEVFTEIYVNMVKAGETGGVLEEVLERVASLTEKEAENKMKIKSATRYPKMVIGAMGVAFFIAVTYIIPTFAKIFKGAKITLPLPTRILIGFNDFVHEYWYLALGGVFLTYLIFRAYIKSEGGRAVWDGLKLRFPIVGQLYTKNLLSRFARILGVLDRSGIPILANLEVVAKVLNNVIVSRAVLNVRRNIEQGRSFAEPLRNSPIFPPMVVHMIAVGEESGTLDDMLFKVSDYYDAEVDNAIKNLSSLIEPLLIFFIGGLVLLLGLGIFMPMWEMATVVGK